MNPSKGSFFSNLVGLIVDSVQDTLMDALQQAIDNRKSDTPNQTADSAHKQPDSPDAADTSAPEQPDTDIPNDDGAPSHFHKLFNKISDQRVKLFQQDVDFDIEYENHVDPITGESREFLVCKKYHGSTPEVRVPDGVQFIAQKAFKDDKSIYTVELPQSLEIIQNQAFENCKNL